MFTLGTSKARCNRRYDARSTGKAMAPFAGPFLCREQVCPARLIDRYWAFHAVPVTSTWLRVSVSIRGVGAPTEAGSGEIYLTRPGLWRRSRLI